jgi:ribosomal protein L18E
LNVTAHHFSESAKQKIEAAGGKAIVVEAPVAKDAA